MTKSILSKRINNDAGLRVPVPDVHLPTSDFLASKISNQTPKQRNFRKRPAQRMFSRLSGVTALAVFGFFATISPISVTDLNQDAANAPYATFASLSNSGTDLVITGSVSDLFTSSTFVGPNRSQKRDRLLPVVDVLELAGSFVAERTRIAALRTAPVDPMDAPQSSPTLGPTIALTDGSPRISVATIDPGLASSALLAIDGVTPDSATLVGLSVPVPLNASEQLAYARQSTPTTEHAVSQYSERERWCLSTAIYFEARGESYRGQVGVAQVIMNRVEHRLYPDTICGVVFQNQSWRNRCQFSFACDGIPERVNDATSWAKAEEITGKVLDGSLYLSEVSNATHYHANYVYPHWAPRMKRLTRIGAHIFYRFRRS